MKFTIIESIYKNEILPQNRFECTWQQFCKRLSAPVIVEDKNSALLISPIEYLNESNAVDFTESGKVRRCADNVYMWYAIPVDIDGQMTIDEAKIRFAEYEFVLYTTFSHQSEAKPFDCFRIFFEMLEPVPHLEFMHRKAAIQKFIGEHDTSTLAGARGFYIPSHSQAGKASAVYFHNQGKAIDVMKMNAVLPEIHVLDTSRDAPSYELKAKVLDTLGRLREVEYDLWWKIGSAMHESGYTYQDFVSLSATIRSHRKNNCKMQWNSSKRKHIGFGYLVNLCVELYGNTALHIPKEPSANKTFNSILKNIQEQQSKINLTK